MSLFSIAETTLIGPIKLLYSLIFTFANRFFDNAGAAIIALSLVVNFLVLPLYNRADAIQKEARDTEKKLKKGMDHIKNTFSGDEKMMILQTYYRQNNYKPSDAFKGSVSILLEIPFFLAAYEYLSNEQALVNVSFGIIENLSKPDALLSIGELTINFLPIVMTLLNIISSAVYTQGFPLKTKIQSYGLAVFFLIFLYNSPSGLAFYWTLNNLFSLGKNVFFSLKNQKGILDVFWKLLPVAFAGYAVYFLLSSQASDDNYTFNRKYPILILMGIVLTVIYSAKIIKIFVPQNNRKAENNKGLLIACSFFMTALMGILIPSALINSSPQEYVFAFADFSPLWYIANNFCLSAGAFLIWLPVFHGLADENGKNIIQKAMLSVCIASVFSYMFFGTNLGNLSADLIFDEYPVFSWKEILLNCIIIIVSVALILFILHNFKKAVAVGTAAAAAAMCCMSAVNIKDSAESLNMITRSDESAHFTLSQKGKNVVVIVLDRAIGLYTPYLFNEDPKLKKQFAGFTYYSNTMSFNSSTNMAMPSVVAGYEYTPERINERADERLVDKHNEALKVLPVLFSENGYNVSVVDPVYANYQWVPDISIFNEYPDIKVFNAEGKFNEEVDPQIAVKLRKHNFFIYSLMKISPLIFQNFMYDNGNYFNNKSQVNSEDDETELSSTQITFLNCYNVVKNLPNMTDIKNNSENNFFFFFNNTTHEPTFLHEPEYELCLDKDLSDVPAYNAEYDAEHTDRFELNGERLLNFSNAGNSIKHYQTNMAVYRRLGEWFDYLRKNNVYDNTRIIIVSDHGRYLSNLGQEFSDPSGEKWQIESFMPLLMFKDFNSDRLVFSDEFMTNADTPTLAVKDIIENPVNPFTGNPINNDAKYEGEQNIILSAIWSVGENNGNKFIPSYWATLKDNVRDINNWTVLDEIK